MCQEFIGPLGGVGGGGGGGRSFGVGGDIELAIIIIFSIINARNECFLSH